MKNTLPLSSFPLQLLLTFQRYFQPFDSIGSGFLLLYKCYNLPYTASMQAQQGILQVLFFIIMIVRINIGISANKTQNSSKILIFLGLLLVGILGACYFIFLQYYVLLIEIIMNAIILVICVLEIIFGFTSFWQFKNYQKQH